MEDPKDQVPRHGHPYGITMCRLKHRGCILPVQARYYGLRWSQPWLCRCWQVAETMLPEIWVDYCQRGLVSKWVPFLAMGGCMWGTLPAGGLWCFFSSVDKETAIISNRVACEASR